MGDAGDEVADVLVAIERRQGELVGFGGGFLTVVFVLTLAVRGVEGGLPGLKASGDGAVGFGTSVVRRRGGGGDGGDGCGVGVHGETSAKVLEKQKGRTEARPIRTIMPERGVILCKPQREYFAGFDSLAIAP